MNTRIGIATVLLTVVWGCGPAPCLADAKSDYKNALKFVEDSEKSTQKRKSMHIGASSATQSLQSTPSGPVPDISEVLKSLSIGMIRLREAFLVQTAAIKNSTVQRSAARALLAQEEVSNLQTASDQLASFVTELGDRRDDLSKQLKTAPPQPSWNGTKQQAERLVTIVESDTLWADLRTQLKLAIDDEEAAAKRERDKPKENVVSADKTTADDHARYMGIFKDPHRVLEIHPEKLILHTSSRLCEAVVLKSTFAASQATLEVKADGFPFEIELQPVPGRPESLQVFVTSTPDCFKMNHAILTKEIQASSPRLGGRALDVNHQLSGNSTEPSTVQPSHDPNRVTCLGLTGNWVKGKKHVRLEIRKGSQENQFEAKFYLPANGTYLSSPPFDYKWNCTQKDLLTAVNTIPAVTLRLEGNKLKVTEDSGYFAGEYKSER